MIGGETMKGKAEKAYKLTPAGEAFLDALLTCLEENTDEITKGLEAYLKQLVEVDELLWGH